MRKMKRELHGVSQGETTFRRKSLIYAEGQCQASFAIFFLLQTNDNLTNVQLKLNLDNLFTD